MKKGDIHWDTIVKLIIALIVFLFLLFLVFILKDNIKEIFNAFVRLLKFG